MGGCVCAILFRDLQCVVAFSDNYRRLLKYRLGLISGRLLGGPEERRRWYLPRLERAWSWFVAIHVENTISSHNFIRERAAPRTAPSTLPSLVQLLVQFLEQPLVHLVVQVLVELLVQLLIPLLI